MNRVCLLFLAIFSLSGSLSAAELLYENGFDNAAQIEPLYQHFKSMEVIDGVLRVEHVTKHAASPTLPITFADGAFRFQIKLAGAQRLTVRFEDESRIENAHAHLCRLEIRPSVATLLLDQPPKDQDRRESQLFATRRENFADERWHEVKIQFTGNVLTATIDGTTKLEVSHEHLSTGHGIQWTITSSAS